MLRKLHQSKKGVFFLLMALMIFMMLTYAYIHLVQKYGKVEQQFGNLQVGAFKAYAQGERDALSVETAGTQDSINTILQLAYAGQSSCGKYFGVPLWYQKTACVPDKAVLKEQFDAALNAQLTQQLTAVGLTPMQYDVTLIEASDGVTVAAIPLQAQEISLSCTQAEQCGMYATKLSFSSKIAYTFAEYGVMQDILARKDGMIDILKQCTSGNSLSNCLSQHLDAFDTAELDFSTACGKGPQDALYGFLESLNDCGTSSDTNCRCGSFSAPALEKIRNLLGNGFQIKLEGDKRQASLVNAGQETVASEQLPKVSLCSFENAYGTQLGASTDFERVINPSVVTAVLEKRSSLLGPATLHVSINGQSFLSLEHPYYPVFKHGNSLCFVPVSTFGESDYAALPACKLPEKKTIKLCATSKRYTLPYFDPIIKHFSIQPVVYTFAVDIM